MIEWRRRLLLTFLLMREAEGIADCFPKPFLWQVPIKSGLAFARQVVR
jgi:hypothetical protein